jgi:ketosteroid isomerase-like protein
MPVQTMPSSAEAQVRAVIETWAADLRAKNADGVISHQATDFVQFALVPPLQANTLDRSGLEEWFFSWQGRIQYEIRDQKITAGDGLAFSHSLNRMTATTIDGEKTDMWFRQTMCFCRTGQTWKITHEHDSVPFYMDEEARAAIDLEP